jgi:hypothetical protein
MRITRYLGCERHRIGSRETRETPSMIRFRENSLEADVVRNLFNNRSRADNPLAISNTRIRGTMGVAMVGVLRDGTTLGYFLPWKWIAKHVETMGGEKGPDNYILNEGRDPDKLFSELKSTMRYTDPGSSICRLPGNSFRSAGQLRPTQDGIDPLRLAAWQMYRGQNRKIDDFLYGPSSSPLVAALYGGKIYVIGGHTRIVDCAIRGIHTLRTETWVIPDEASNYGDSLMTNHFRIMQEAGPGNNTQILCWNAIDRLGEIFEAMQGAEK